MKWLFLLLVFVPLAILADLLGWSPVVVFGAAALGVVPLAAFLGRATEELATRAGPRLGGLLNATLGNAAELIIALFAIRQGLLKLVKASITGSILGNILFVLGMSFLLGGRRHGRQRFDRGQAGVNATMLTLAVIALAVPSLFSHSIEESSHAAVEYLSLGVASVMMLLYVLSILYSFGLPSREDQAGEVRAKRAWDIRLCLGVLAASTVFIAWLSEILVAAVEPVMASLGVTEFFLGIVVIPLVGNVVEHLVAVQMALKDKMELSLAISLGSGLQVALFVAPLLVFASLALGNPLTLIFDEFELIALVAASLLATLAALDGESNWLEGAQLLAVYIIVALAFFFLPV
ncbi:MAG: calcium/proton exchanger [Anaerolineae bacterium]